MTDAGLAVASQARAVAIICMLVSGLSGTASVTEAVTFSDSSSRTMESLPHGTPTADLLARLTELKARAMQPDRGIRAAVLLVLAVSLFFTFVSAGRVLRPAGLPREGIRKLLCAGALASAVLRTIDGAADAAFSLRMAKLAPGLFPSDARLSEPWVGFALTGGFSIVPTLLVAGTLAIVAQYFRSARGKAWAALHDEPGR